MEGVEEVSHTPPCDLLIGEMEGVLRVTGRLREEMEEGEGFGGPIGEVLAPIAADTLLLPPPDTPPSLCAVICPVELLNRSLDFVAGGKTRETSSLPLPLGGLFMEMLTCVLLLRRSVAPCTGGGLFMEMLTCVLLLWRLAASCTGGDKAVWWGGIWLDGLAGRGVAWFSWSVIDCWPSAIRADCSLLFSVSFPLC